ncbi:MAG: G5 domain-containing protein [Armatimonadota bacterium]
MDQNSGREDRLRQALRSIERLESALRYHRAGLLVAVAVITALLLIMAFGNRGRYARAIIVDDEIVCLVATRDDAEEVRKRLVKDATKDLPGEAFIKEKWEDAAIPADERPVLGVKEAVEKLNDKVTVHVEAVNITVEGNDVVAMASEELAKKALDALKARYSGAEDGKIISQELKEDVSIRSCSAAPDEISTDIRQTAQKLAEGTQKPVSYTVKKGDYPEKIALAHDMKVETLYEMNSGLKGRTLHPGETLTVGTKTPPITVITVTEVSREEPIPPPVEEKKSSSLQKGQRRVAAEGQAGKKQLTLRLTLHNDKTVDRKVIDEEIIEEPSPKRVLVGTAESS